MAEVRAWTVALAAVLACSASGDGSSPTQGVVLRSGTVRADAGLTADTPRVLVEIDRSQRRRSLALLGEQEAGVEAPVGPDGYLVSLAPGSALDVRAGLGMLGGDVMSLEPELKVAPELRGVPAEQGATVIVVVDLFADADPENVAAELGDAGLPVRGYGRGPRFGRVTMLAPAVGVEELALGVAGRDDVAWVGRRFPRRLHNGTSVWVGQSGLDGGGATPLFDHGLRGEGQIAGLLDTGVDIDHCYFRDDAGLPAINGIGETQVDESRRKVIAVDFVWEQDDPNDPGDWDDMGHGTHVGGTIAGDSPGPLGEHNGHDGMAPAAKLVVQDGGYEVDDCADMPALGCPAADLHPLFEQAYAQGARVHQNSWGDNENAEVLSVYTDGSQDADEFVWEHPDFLLVFSAGNSGPDLETIIGPATAKNVLAVGATRRADEAHIAADFSSRGPTDDGRVKPDVMFPGVQIRSAESDGDINTDNCGTRGMSGTSMSGPGAAGMAVLVRQYFMDGFYPGGAANDDDAFVPSAALLKATLINSAQPMTGVDDTVPSPVQGWGRILLDETLYFEGDSSRLFVDDHANGFEDETDDLVQYAVLVVSADEPLQATLVWTDYPSTSMAATNLVNDLDLRMNGPDGELWGNAIEDGESVTGGEPDRINNVEQIIVAAPTPGIYTLRVLPHAIPQGPQPFALVLRGDVTAEEVPPSDDTDTGTDTGSGTGGTGGTGSTGSTGTETHGGGSGTNATTEPIDPTDAPDTEPDEGGEDDEESGSEDGGGADTSTRGCACGASRSTLSPLAFLLVLLCLRRRVSRS